MLVRPVMKRLFCLKAKNGLGRFAPSVLTHYNAAVILQLYQAYLKYIRMHSSMTGRLVARAKQRLIFPPTTECIRISNAGI